MNILFWSDGFWPRIGGIESQSLHFIESMQKMGHRYIVLAQKDDLNWKDEECYNSIIIKRFDFNSIIDMQRLTILRNIEAHLDNIIKDFKPDILHLNTTIGASAFVFLLFKKILKIPIVLTVHSIYPYKDKILPVTEKIILSADKICAVSHSVLRNIHKYIPQVSEKSICIYNGLSLPDLIPTPLVFNPPVMLCLGRLSSEKRFDLAIRAAAQVKLSTPEFQVIIAGEGPERNNLEILVASLRANYFITFTGSVNLQKIPELINQATMVVMPSSFESFGLVALEAAQMQRPVIATNVGGLPEVVLDKETGILVPPDNLQALCDAIQALLINPDLARQMGKRGRQRALTTFTLNALTTEYDKVYTDFTTNTMYLTSG